MMRTELGLDVELCSVFWLSCGVSQGVNGVEVVDLLFPDQYVLLEGMYEECFPAVHFRSLIACF
jgi:hypothetical protein